MKKSDGILFLLILAAALAGFGILHVAGKNGAHTIRITVDGKWYGEYDLEKDQVIPIGSSNVCEIRDGRAFMKEADCPDQLCIHQKQIDENGGMIICLPNKVFIEGTGPDGETQLDAVAGSAP